MKRWHCLSESLMRSSFKSSSSRQFSDIVWDLLLLISISNNALEKLWSEGPSTLVLLQPRAALTIPFAFDSNIYFHNNMPTPHRFAWPYGVDQGRHLRPMLARAEVRAIGFVRNEAEPFVMLFSDSLSRSDGTKLSSCTGCIIYTVLLRLRLYFSF